MNDMAMKVFQEKTANALSMGISTVSKWIGKKLAGRPIKQAVEGLVEHDTPAFARKAAGGEWHTKFDDNGAVIHPKPAEGGSFKTDLLLNTALSAPAVLAAKNATAENGPSVAEYAPRFKQYI